VQFFWLVFPASLAFVWICFLAGFFPLSVLSLLWPLWEVTMAPCKKNLRTKHPYLFRTLSRLKVHQPIRHQRIGAVICALVLGLLCLRFNWKFQTPPSFFCPSIFSVDYDCRPDRLWLSCPRSVGILSCTPYPTLWSWLRSHITVRQCCDLYRLRQHRERYTCCVY